jgi:L-lactate dehydrogenase
MGVKINFTIAGLTEKFVLEYVNSQPTPDEKKFLRLKIATSLKNKYLPLHACLIEKDGRGILISGKSKSGKSTLAESLLKKGFRILANDFVVAWEQDGILYVGDLNYEKENLNKKAVPVYKFFFLLPDDPRDIFSLCKSEAINFYIDTLEPLKPSEAKKLTEKRIFSELLKKHLCLGNRKNVTRWQRCLLEHCEIKTHSRVGILGMGVVGQDIANLLVGQDWIKGLELFSRNKQKLKSLVLDFKSANPTLPIEAHGSIDSLLSKSDVVVVCLRIEVDSKLDVEERMAKLLPHAQALWEISRSLRSKNFKGKILMVTNPIDLLSWCVYYFSQISDKGNLDWKGLFSSQVLGMGPGLDYRRLLVYSPHSHLDVSGPHGDLLRLTQLSRYGQHKAVHHPRILQKVLNYSQAIREGVSRTRFGPAHELVSIVTALNRDLFTQVRVSTLTRDKVFLCEVGNLNTSGILHSTTQTSSESLETLLRNAISQQREFQELILKYLALPLIPDIQITI